MGDVIMHLLMVEASANDAALLLNELKRNGISAVHERVESRADFLSALPRRAWDAVIANLFLPQFSGLEALKLLRHRGLDLPFIMLSGIYGEAEAVSVIKAGADDYILKGNLSRLAPALDREIEAAKDRRRRKRAEGAMQFLAAIVESSEDAIYGKNLDSLIVSWNPAAERLFGYSAEEATGRSIAMLFPPSRRDEMLDILASIRRGDTVGALETERLHKSGRVFPVAVTVSPVRDPAGEIIGASAITRDVSKQKQAEVERQQLVERLISTSKQLRTLSGLLPICASCKRIRDDRGYWDQVDTFLSKHSAITFTHSLCPACAAEYERELQYHNQ